MSKFGWSYPPGAAGDPYAPYNQVEDDMHCGVCGADLPEYPEEDTPEWEGFCSEECRKKYYGKE